MTMNLLDAYTTLVDCARQQPETPHLRRAIKRVEKKIEVMRSHRSKRHERLAELLRVTQ